VPVELTVDKDPESVYQESRWSAVFTVGMEVNAGGMHVPVSLLSGRSVQNDEFEK
jgi:hypothetical protein